MQNQLLSQVFVCVMTMFIMGCTDPQKENSGPTLFIRSPIHASWVHEVVTISIEVVDQPGLLSVAFLIDDSLHFTDTTEPFEYDWNTTGLSDSSTHRISAVAYDDEAASLESVTIEVIVDNSSFRPATLDLYRPVYINGAFILNWSASPDSDFLKLEIYESLVQDMSVRDLVYTTENPLDTTHTINGIPLSEKRYYQLEITDHWGLKSWSDIQTGNSYKMFTRLFGAENEDIGYSVAQTSTGGYIITGINRSTGNGYGDLWLICTNADGEELWSHLFGGEYKDYGREVIQTNEGGFIITGYTNAEYDGAWLLKTDPQGNEEWNQAILDSYNFKSVAFSVDQTMDGGFVVTGCTNCDGYNSVDSDLFLAKTDNQGLGEWVKTFGGNSGESGIAVQETSDGGFIIIGTEVLRVWLIKTDSQGNEEWNRTFGDVWAGARSGQQTNDGGYIILGFNSSNYSDSDVWLIKTDSEGNEEWNSVFEFASDYCLSREQAFSVQQTIDGGYIITGKVDCGGTEGALWLVKSNSLGDQEWGRSYSLSTTSYDIGFSVQQTDDGGYVVVGVGGDFHNGDLLFIKTDPEGNTVPYDN